MPPPDEIDMDVLGHNYDVGGGERAGEDSSVAAPFMARKLRKRDESWVLSISAARG